MTTMTAPTINEALARLAMATEHHDRQLDDHESRLRALERQSWRLAAMVTTAAAIGGGLASLVTAFLKLRGL